MPPLYVVDLLLKNTLRVNGGYNGLEDRKQLYSRWIAQIGMGDEDM
jgi:hypothetical protein